MNADKRRSRARRITTSPPARGGVAHRAGVVGDDTPLKLSPKLKAILAQEYPRFSDAEYARRHKALAALMEKNSLDHLLVITDHRTGNAPQWVTGWPGTVEAYVIFKPGEKMWMSSGASIAGCRR